MFSRIIGFSIRNPLIIGIGVLALIIWGVVSFRSLPIDAVPDITNNQVQVVTLTPALAPQEVERLITIPVEQTMATIAGIVERRSISRFGLSVVTLVFEDDVDVYWARAQVDQRLSEAAEVIPPGAGTPMMMPITTGLGEIFQYRLEVAKGLDQRYDAMELRTIHDWMVRRRLLGTEGVADVASFGGFLRQVEIAVTPERLRSFGLSISDVLEHVERNNGNSGGAYIERGPNVAYIRTEGIATTLDDIANIIVGQTEAGLPILVKDVATVRNGSAVRYGALTHNDAGESVGGIVYMLKGANSSQVIDNVKKRIAEIERTLPEGITVAPYLDRSHLVDRTIRTVATNLIEGALIVIFVLVLMLGNLRAGFIVASVIPLSMLFAIGMMRTFGVSGNLMSLGAIDFGLIVDGAVIIVEHVLHRLSGQGLKGAPTGATRNVIEHAAVEIRRSAAFGEFIILIVYVPILTLVGIEGKMFKPMAQTVMFAILGAFLLSTTYVPMMSALLLRNVKQNTVTLADRIMRFMHRQYTPVRHFALRHPASLISLSAAGLVLSAAAFFFMGAEFIPSLSEGDFAVETRLKTGSSLNESIKVTQQASRILLDQFPEVKECVGKIGTTEIPLDPMPIEACDLMVILKPRSEWTSASSREELADKMQQALEAIPGVEFGFQQPIQMRFNELMTGARQDVVIKVFGDDLSTLVRLSRKIGAIVASVDGAADIYEEPVDGLPQIVVRVDRRAAALMGVNVEDVNTTVRAAFAGEAAGSLYEQERRFDVVVRLDPSDRTSITTLERLSVPTHDGRLVPLPQVASIDLLEGPNQIQREEGRRRIYVGLNVRDRDVQSLVDEIHARISREVPMPPGYEITYGGQFENLQAATNRLMIAVPAALLLILFLLYMTFGRIAETLLVFTAIPLSAIGGVAALALRGLPFSISAGVGFIALFGVAVLNGIVLMAAFIKHEDLGPLRTVLRGTNDRLRPVAMTALVASLGFLPMAISTSDGAEVQRPLATVVIGGLISSTLLTLVVLPALYFVVKRRMKATRRMVHTGTSVVSLVLLLFLTSVVPAVGQQPTALSREAIRSLVLQRNISIEQARNRTQQADVLKGAAVDLGPTRVMWTGGQYNADAFDNALAIEQSIPFPTRLAASASLAGSEWDHARTQEALVQRNVLMRVEQAFDRIAYAREMLRLLDRLDSVLSRAVRASERGQRAGAVPTVTVLTAQSQRSEIGVRRLTVQTQLHSAETELRILCRDSAVTIADTSLVRRNRPPRAALAPVITAEAEQRIRVAEERSDYAASAWWPEINLMYTNQTMIGVPLSGGGDATSGNRFQYFGVGLNLPLWFGPTRARAQQAELEHSITSASTTADLDALQRRSEQLERELETLERTMDHYDGPSAEQVRLLVDHAERAYDAGEIGWSQYQQAIETAVEIRVNRLDALLRHNDVVITLEQLTKE